MRVVVVTAEEPLYLPRYLEPLVASHHDVIAEVVIVPPARGVVAEARRYLRAFGPRAALGFGSLAARGRLRDALPAGLGRRLTGRHRVASLADHHDIPVRRAPDPSAGSFVGHLDGLDPDLLLAIAPPQRLPRSVLDVPTLACNLHGSLLPAYRGRATAFWPLYHDDDETGVTAHVMTEAIDAGPIIEQRAVDIDESDTMHDLMLRLTAVGGELAVDLVDRFRTRGVPAVDDLETRPNPPGPTDYHTLPTPAERRAFRRRGNAFR